MDARRTLLVGLGMVVLAAGCKAPTDLNKPCNLVKKGDGGAPYNITEGEVQERLKKHPLDFITFGSIDCEDLTCVRDANYPGGTDPNAFAQGYCSGVCNEGSKCSSFDEKMDKDKTTALRCRPLLLDEATLSVLCNPNDPATATNCQSVGNTQKPFFCARGSSDFDAGL